MSYTSTKTVSAVNTPENDRLREMRMVPLGACVWTSSGALAAQGITGIAQAASGAMDSSLGKGFDPTSASIDACIRNSFLLAACQGHTSLALPFIAGGIFYTRIEPPITRDELGAIIVESCISHRGSIDAVIVAYDESDMGCFRKAMKGVAHDGVRLVQGSIVKFSDHNCTAIVNAANLEVIFGGGISGVIARATNDQAGIDAEAAKEVAAFWEVNSME